VVKTLCLPAKGFFISMKGILLIALGNAFYGRCAYNMALSIKLNDPEAHITLLYSEQSLSSLSDDQRGIFNTIKEVPQVLYMQDGKCRYLNVKTYMYDLSPYDRTLYIDVDALWMPGKKVSDLFEELKEVDFTIGCHTRCNMETLQSEKNNYIYWGDVGKIRDYFRIRTGYMPQTQSAFVYFRKCYKIRAYFDIVIAINNDEHCPHTPWINGGKGDEYCFNVASALSGIMPHQIPYHPTHFFQIAPILNDTDLAKNYWAIQMGGGKCEEWIVQVYNKMLKEYYLQAGSDAGFYHQNKKDVITEREGW
jgi:hypothetical protein